MSKLEIDGITEMMESLENIMDLPDDVQFEMLNAQADVVVEAHKKEIEAIGLEDTGQLKRSISRTRKLQIDDLGQYLEIYPQGIRDDGVRNTEVGFIHEFGAPNRGIKASNWMENANEKCAEEAVGAAAQVYYQFLEQNNL